VLAVLVQLLPALILRSARGRRREPAQAFGSVIVRMFGFRRPAAVCAVAVR